MSEALALLEQGVSDGIVSTRDALLGALLGVPAVRRLVCNVLAAQKRYAESAAPTIRQFEDWLADSHEDTLASWYWRYGYFEVDVFEALLDAKYQLI